MDNYMYAGALLDDSQIGSHDPDEDLNNETFGDGFGDGGDWEENQHQQQAEFERLRQQDLGIVSQNYDHFSAPAQTSAHNGADSSGETDFFGRQVPMQAPTRLDKELKAPSYFQNDDVPQPHDISRDLDRLLSEDDGVTTGDTDDREDVRWMNGAPGGAFEQPNWTGGMQHIPPRTMGGDVPSATGAMGRLDLHQLGRPAMGRDPMVTRAAATESSMSPAHTPTHGSNHHPAPSGGLNLTMLLGAGASPGAGGSRPSPSVKGGRLEDIESTLRNGPSPAPPPTHRGDSYHGADRGDPAKKNWVDHMQLLHSQGPMNRASTPPDGLPRPGLDGMPPRAPHMMPPRPAGAPRPPPGSSPSGPPPRPDGRPGFPPMLPPNMPPPPMHPSFRGMQPPPWFMGGMPPSGQRLPDMSMLRYPMPPGMRPPGLDPNWRGPPPPNFRPIMPMGPPPPPGAHPGLPPQMSSPSGSRQRQQQQQQRNVMDYPFVFMTNKEKDWIRKVQLIQLSKFSSWMDDYYYLKYRHRHPSARPMLGIPKLDDDFEIKPESPFGRITIFEGALGGRISTGSVHCPRQTLMIDGPINVSSATSPPGTLISKMHRSRQLLNAIERAYVQLLELEDDQPHSNVSVEDRRAAVSKVFQSAKVRPLQERLRDLKDVSSDEHAVVFMSIPKGARLVTRMLPKLSMPEAQSLAGLLCHHLLPFMKRDEEKASVKVLLRGLQDQFQRWSLGVLVRLLDMLNAQTVTGNVAAVALLVEQYSSAAVAFLNALVKSGYEQCAAGAAAPVKQWCQSCHRLYILLEPHRDVLTAHLADDEKAAYFDFVQLLARAASGQFSAAGSA